MREPQHTAQSLQVALGSHHDPAWSQPACPEASLMPCFGASCCPAHVPAIFPPWTDFWSPGTLTKSLSLLLEGISCPLHHTWANPCPRGKAAAPPAASYGCFQSFCPYAAISKKVP